MKTTNILFAIFGSYWTCATAVHAATAIFQTGDFTPGEWTSVFSGTGTASAATESTGGNPGAYRGITLSVLSTKIGNYSEAAQLWEVAQFTPAIQGAISSVSLSYDITLVSSTYKPYAVTGIAVRQYGLSCYYSPVGSSARPPNWETISWTNIVPLFPQVNWTSGGTITFGLSDKSSNSDVPHTMNTGYDNFRLGVTYSPIPEPSTFALIALAVVSKSIRRSRNAKPQLPAKP